MFSMEITTVLIVRHGQTASNVSGRYMGWIDEDLSDEGVWQAEQLSHRLAGWSITSVYSSPLRRANRTAEIIAAPHSIPVSIVDGLGEIRVGAWEGKFGKELEAEFPDLWRLWKTDPSTVRMPGGESLSQVRERAIASLEDIVEANRGHQVLMVTHDVVVRLLVAYCLGASSSIYRRLDAGNASLTIIQVGDGWLRLRLMNDRGHLEVERH